MTLLNEEAQKEAFAEECPGWEAWRSIKGGQWHARKIGAEPPFMIHDNNCEGLIEQVHNLARI
jgi:hypothetical protein